MDSERRDLIAQWAFDTSSILGRFHLWLDDVEERSVAQRPANEPSTELSTDGKIFTGPALQRAFVMSAAVTALGTRLYGRFGAGKGLDKAEINRVKKDADAVSAYSLSEALWYLSRALPENHALMVCLGEGLMPKAGETEEMGSNPLLGFGRIYARPEVAKAMDARIARLLNDQNYGFEEFWQELQAAGITVWGAAIDTLECTSRFAHGESGPLTVLHVYDQPLTVAAPYEGYIGNLVLPRQVVETAAEASSLLHFGSARRLVLEACQLAYPDIPAERVHVWTLQGDSRQHRLGALWQEWQDLGVHLVEDGYPIPGGSEVFTDSGTYTPVTRVGVFEDDNGDRHLWLCDGYAASAEAIQGASLDPVHDTHTSLDLLSSVFHLPWHRERLVMALEPSDEDFSQRLADIAGDDFHDGLVQEYRQSIEEARAAGLITDRSNLSIADFVPRKKWDVLAVSGFMLADPYSGCPGIEDLGDGRYKVTVRAASRQDIREVQLTLRLLEDHDESRLVFSPLLERFCQGEDFRQRAVKISDSGRIRNELQTLFSEALEHLEGGRLLLRFSKIGEAAMPPAKKAVIRQALEWYQERHPIWFGWLELAD